MSRIGSISSSLPKFQLGRQMPVLHFLLVALCFFVFPGLIFFRGIDGIIELKVIEKKQQAEIMLQNRLDRLEFFSSNDRLAHYLLDSL